MSGSYELIGADDYTRALATGAITYLANCGPRVCVLVNDLAVVRYLGLSDPWFAR
jgi:hypothetical protein